MDQHIQGRLRKLKAWLEANPAIELREFNRAEIPADVLDYAAPFNDGSLPPGLAPFYRQFNGFGCKWVHKTDARIAGYARFLPLEEMYRYWDGSWTLQPGDPDADALTNGFFPIDFFNDEACVGAFRNDHDPFLYYYNFHGAPQNLFIGIAAYFELMCYAKAYRYWPYLILEINSGSHSRMGDELRTGMSVLNGEFDMKEFIALYHRLKVQ